MFTFPVIIIAIIVIVVIAALILGMKRAGKQPEASVKGSSDEEKEVINSAVEPDSAVSDEREQEMLAELEDIRPEEVDHWLERQMTQHGAIPKTVKERAEKKKATTR